MKLKTDFNLRGCDVVVTWFWTFRKRLGWGSQALIVKDERYRRKKEEI